MFLENVFTLHYHPSYSKGLNSIKLQEYKGKLKVFKIDHDANPQLVQKYKVYGLPTLLLFKDGQEVSGSRREGAITKDKLKVYLDQLLETVAAR